MSTRGLAGVVIDGTIKASYNHSDSYPSWLGIRFLADAAKLAALSPDEYDNVMEAWREVILVDEDVPPTAFDIATLEERGFTMQHPAEGDWYYLLHESQGSLDSMLKAGYVLDASEFGGDALFCEWAYLIDLTNRTLEVYAGESPVGRWPGGVGLVQKYSLDELPTEAAFLAALEPKQED